MVRVPGIDCLLKADKVPVVRCIAQNLMLVRSLQDFHLSEVRRLHEPGHSSGIVAFECFCVAVHVSAESR